jgi:hypothetical protein
VASTRGHIRLRMVANITGDLMLVALFDRWRSLPEPGDCVTVVPHAEAFGGAVQDLPQTTRKAQTGR